jgi:uncharacterized protein (DUF2126 family)/transglutaminase-like putative cysteine protease
VKRGAKRIGNRDRVSSRAVRVRIRHQTRYHYDEPALLGPHLVRLRPAEHARAKILAYNLAIAPEGEVHWQQDPSGNRVARLTLPAGKTVDELAVTVDLAVDVRPVNPFDFFVDDRCRDLPFEYPDGLAGELAPFLAAAHPPPSDRLRAFLATIPARGYITDYLVALNRKVASEVRYIIRNEPGIQKSDETLAIGSGSCRDSAVLLCDVLRAGGLAARFVSGYLVQLTDEGNIPDLAKGVLRDVVDLHAWCEVYVPGGGWIGLDGTSGLLAGEGHIPLACTANAALASPIDGTSSRAASRFDFVMEVVRLGHEPRPRVPYTDDEWSAIRACGGAVDDHLRASELRLTMGGEPTFTSREHPREPEWNEGAIGATKWEQGLRLTKELYSRFAPHGVFLHRTGKHYPGESLPRWALDVIWRRDRAPLFREPALLDFDGEEEVSLETAEAFARALAPALGIEDTAIAAYEDPWIAIVHEMNLPDDVDPLKASLDDPEERRTLSRILGRGAKKPVGFALPIARGSTGGWVTSRWTFKRGALFLLFGDSPMGLRLPLDRIGGKPFAQLERDVTIAPEPLVQHLGDAPFVPPDPAREFVPSDEKVRTAFCVEPRDGALYVYLPPVPAADDFVEIVRAVEDVAAKLGQRIRLEGYPPPSDPRLDRLSVTPDPGVLEVNLPVSERFDDYVALQETIADAALRCGLTCEKYQLDGREVGSGGGHHLTLGGPTTVESPWLTRPALLASFLRYLQNHPSLSFLFTSMFVGPTSQAPRVDEARLDSLLELELALGRAENETDAPPPWLIDRIFRNLLVDLTGNTHRTEVSIDKLYDPHGLSGRQGIVELRAFEMPPHERMACAQMLLVRAIVARLARSPYREPLVRWGTELHDRFMLPHYLWADLSDVARDLREHALPIERAWYRPFLDWRFPVLGTMERDDVVVELRSALEPWHVLGETPSQTGTSRYVDSSLERIQVRVDGITEHRHAVMVNGLRLPLRPTGRASERVAGVRFRAWQPPHCLHPEIGVHHPLHVDLVDTWAKRSLGRATHHVWHPDGRGYDEPPLTAFEAAARRAQRFTTEGHAPYPAEPIATEPHPEHPFTLDLRRYAGDRRIPKL